MEDMRQHLIINIGGLLSCSDVDAVSQIMNPYLHPLTLAYLKTSENSKRNKSMYSYIHEGLLPLKQLTPKDSFTTAGT